MMARTAQPAAPMSDDAKLADLDARIGAVKQSLRAVRERIQAETARSAAGDTGRGHDAKHKSLRDQLAAAQKTQGDARRRREETLARIKTLTETADAMQAELKHLWDTFGVRSLRAAEDRIRHLEAKISAGTMKLIEEKKAASEVANLKRARPLLESMDAKQVQIEQSRREAAELTASLSAANGDGASPLADYAQIKREIETLEADKKRAYERAQQLYSERNALDEQLMALHQERAEILDRVRQAEAAAQRKRAEDRKRRMQQKAEEQRRARQDKAREFAEQARELAAIPAYTDEIIAARHLLTYLHQHTDGAVKSSAVSNPTKKAQATITKPQHNIRRVETEVPAGATVLRRDADEDDYFAPLVKKNNSKRGRARRQQQQQPLEGAERSTSPSGRPESTSSAAGIFKFPLGVVEQFWKVGVDVPVTKDDAQRACAELEAKIAWYTEHQAEATRKKQAAAEQQIAAALLKAGLIDSADEVPLPGATASGSDMEQSEEQDAAIASSPQQPVEASA